MTGIRGECNLRCGDEEVKDVLIIEGEGPVLEGGQVARRRLNLRMVRAASPDGRL